MGILYSKAAGFFVFLICLILLSAYPGVSKTTRVTLDEWRLAHQFGSPRLLLKAILKEQPRGGQRLAYELAETLGVSKRNNQKLSPKFSFGVKPIIEYDHNINGGLPVDRFIAGPFTFTVNEASRAKSGMTYGIQASGDTSLVLGKGLLFSAGAVGWSRKSFDHDISVSGYALTACFKYTSDNWLYYDYCKAKYSLRRSLSEESREFDTLTAGRVFSRENSTHDVNFSIINQKYLDRNQKRIRFYGRSSLYNMGVFDYGLTVGQRVDGLQVQTLSAAVGFGTFFGGRPSRVSLVYIVDEGGKFFDQKRSDNRVILRAERKITNKIEGFVSFEKKTSSVDIFSDEVFNAGLDVVGIRW